MIYIKKSTDRHLRQRDNIQEKTDSGNELWLTSILTRLTNTDRLKSRKKVYKYIYCSYNWQKYKIISGYVGYCQQGIGF